MTGFKTIFETNEVMDTDVSAKEAKMKEHVKYRMPGTTYVSCRPSYAATRFEIKADASAVGLYTTNKHARVVDAVFDVNGCVCRQDGSKIIIEVPNENKTAFHFSSAVDTIDELDTEDNNILAAYAGEDMQGNPMIINFDDTPHLMIAGNTGSGKSVCFDNLLLSMLYKYSPKELELYAVDIKKTEMGGYVNVPHTKKCALDRTGAFKTITTVIDAMENRIAKLSEEGYTDVLVYNEDHPEGKIPHILLAIEEIDSLLIPNGNSEEENNAINKLREDITFIANQGRAAGVHIILASQRPSGKSIGTPLRSQIPGRIALKVQSSMDSRMIIDQKGAEKLRGKGDAYWKTEDGVLRRFQVALITSKEVKAAQEWLKEHWNASIAR